MKIRSAIVMALFFLQTGCTIYSVSDHHNKGIPFLPIQTVYTRKDTYMKDWYELSLITIVQAGKGSSSKAVFYTDDASYATETNILFVLGGQVDPVKKRFADCKAPPASCTGPNTSDLMSQFPHAKLIGSEITQSQQPAEKYKYINVRRPLIGDASATITLAANGTLASAQASVSSKTGESILSVLPISDFLKSKFPKSAAEIKDVDRPDYYLQVDAVRIMYVFSKRFPCEGDVPEKDKKDGTSTAGPSCFPKDKLDTSASDVTKTIEVIRASDKATKGDSADQKSIKVQGTIVLPDTKP